MVKIILQGEEEKKKNIYYEVDTNDPVIGEGGMGKVMKGKCVDVATGVSRPVAIKFLYDDLPPHAIERARREASIRLRNDNLIEMLGFVETETRSGEHIQKHYHVVSELLHGVSLLDILEGKYNEKSGKDIPIVSKLFKDYHTDSLHFAKFIVKNVLTGLVALHDAGYVHRDIDPSNIMITEEGHIKLIDFGIAKQVNKLTTNDCGLTTAGVFMGKAEYAAPELALGDLKHQNQTTDIYAVGILLYQCIVGHVPFAGASHEVLEKQIKKKIQLSVVKDRKIRKIIECATAKNQRARYQSASQMRVAMEEIDGQKMQMNKTKKISLISMSALAVIFLLFIFSYSHIKKQITNEALVQEEIAMNDSLYKEVLKLKAESDLKYQNGNKHGEGYEQEYIDAYICLSNAISKLNMMTESDIEVTSLTSKRDSIKSALLAAKEEFEMKASDFASNGMEDIAEEFYNRSSKISNVLKSK